MNQGWMDSAAGDGIEGSLDVLSRMVDALDDVVEQQLSIEGKLSAIRKQRMELEEKQIPDFLDQFGISELRLKDGRKVSVTRELKVSLPSRDLNKRRAVLQFIASHGGAAIIKDELVMENPDERVVEMLMDGSVDFTRKDTIHSSTLKAFFSEILGFKKGFDPKVSLSDVPEEAGLYIFRKTKIK